MNRLEVGAFARTLPSSMRTQLTALMQAVRSEDGAAFAVLALSTLPYLWLIWGHEFLPMQDLSGHVELAFLHARLAAQDPAYTPFYRVAPQPWPNSLSTLVLSGFGSQLGFERGVKALLGVYVVAWPVSLGILAKLVGRSPLVALFAVPTILEFNWAFGFFNYLLAKPLVIASVCSAIVFSRAPNLIRAGALICSIWLTFLAHGIAFMVSGVWAGLAVLCFSRGAFRVLNLWPLVLSLAIPLRYALMQRNAPPPPGEWIFGTWDQMLSTLWHYLGQLNPSDGEEIAYLFAAAAWLLTIVLQPQTPLERRSDRARGAAQFILTSAVVLFIAYGRGPLFMPNVDIICQRLLVFVWALLMIVPLTLPVGFARYLVAACMLAAVSTHVYVTGRNYTQFNEIEMKGFSEIIEMIPPGKSLAVFNYRTVSPFARENALWHWAKLYGVRRGRGAHTDDSFAMRSTSYVNLTDAARQAGTYTDVALLNPSRLSLFDYQLSIGGPKEGAIANMASVADYVASRSEWHLFRVRKPQ